MKKYDGVIGVAKDGKTVVAVTRTSATVSIESLDRLDALIEESGMSENISRKTNGLMGMEVRLAFSNACGGAKDQAVLRLKSLLAESGVMVHPYVSMINHKIVGARALLER